MAENFAQVYKFARSLQTVPDNTDLEEKKFHSNGRETPSRSQR